MENNPQNIVEKIWHSHVIRSCPGFPELLAVDLVFLHEVTSPQAFQILRQKGLHVFDSGKCLATIDHVVSTRLDREAIAGSVTGGLIETLRKNAKTFCVPLLDMGSGYQGVVHVVGPELGASQPGMIVVCGDSHTSTHGAMGALAFGIGSSELGSVLGSGCLLLPLPKTMKVEFCGELRPGVFAKDAALELVRVAGPGGANGYVIEYSGEAVSQMSVEERLTLSNMSVECGARAGLVSPDRKTIDYLKGRPCVAEAPRRWEEAVAHWLSFTSDPGCRYDREEHIDVSALKPMVTWGTNPGQAVAVDDCVPVPDRLLDGEQQAAHNALAYVGLKGGQRLAGVSIDSAFIGSCTNGRIEDLRTAARVLKGRRVASSVVMYVVPGSEAVYAQAVAEGLDRVFKEAGALWRKPGCSLCLAMNEDRVPPGKRCISSSNRNFIGRQGEGSITHLASPATVAASAVAGKITSPEEFL